MNVVDVPAALRLPDAVGRAPKVHASDLGDQGLLEEVEVLEGEAGAEGDAVERVLGHVARHAGHLGEQLVDVPQRAIPRRT